MAEKTKQMVLPGILTGEMLKDSLENIPSDQKMKLVSDMANKQLELIDEIEAIETNLKRAKEELSKVSEYMIPEAMESIGLQEIKLSDGSKLSIKSGYQASITKAKETVCFNWLRKNGHGDLIKHIITTKFGKGEEKEAKKLCSVLKKAGVNYSDKESVHPQTLKAFVTEQIPVNPEFPQELFSVFPVKKSVIVKSKK